MPIVRIEMLPGRTQQQKDELIKAMTNAMATIAKTSTEAVHVIIVETAAEHWGMGGETIAARNKKKAAK